MSDAQLDIFRDTPVTVVARRADPDTSQQAAKALEAQQNKLQASVRAVVQLLEGGRELTDFEIAARWPSVWEGPFSESLPRKARHWARQAGKVEFAGYALHGNRTVRTWRLTA